MDYKVVHSLVSAILFLVLASPPVYSNLRKVIKDPDMSLVVRSMMFGLIMYLLMANMSL